MKVSEADVVGIRVHFTDSHYENPNNNMTLFAMLYTKVKFRAKSVDWDKIQALSIIHIDSLKTLLSKDLSLPKKKSSE